jgi:hypothetical protein
MTEDRFGNLTGQGTIHHLTVTKVLLVRLTTVIVVGKHLGGLPEQFQVVRPSTIRTGHRTYIKRGNLTGEISVGVTGGEVNDDPVFQIRTLVGVERIGELDSPGMPFQDYYILIFHTFIPP